jgi:methylase of polypeptide subunit release factors
LNPAAVRNALLNAREMGFMDRFEARLVPRRSPGAWTVMEPAARFDLIISNPPWENSRPASVEQFALYDPNFDLLKSLVTGTRARLKPGGRMWLAYGCVTAIRRIQEVAADEKLQCRLLEERSLDTLPELFLPGMLIEITVD